IELVLDVVAEGRSTATAIVAVHQNGRRCLSVTVLADVPTPDVIRHQLPRPDVAAPAEANHAEMPMIGRELRLVDVVDVNSPDEVGRRELYAWLTYAPIPTRTIWPRRWLPTSPGISGSPPPCVPTRASAPARHT